jgi:hypothetical protein
MERLEGKAREEKVERRQTPGAGGPSPFYSLLSAVREDR